MTELCGGGASEPKAGAADFVQVAASLLVATAPGWAWLVPYLKYIEPAPVVVANLCDDDPPDLPELTGSDVFSLVTGGRAGAGLVGLEKFSQLLQHYAWFHLCQCSAAATPAPTTAPAAPSDLPAPAPSGASATVRIKIKRAQCKILNLWNGSSNNAVPTNWQHPAFDDSGWADPAVIDDNLPELTIGYQNGVQINPPVPSPTGGQEAVGFTTVAAAGQQFLIRWKVPLPYVPTRDTIHLVSGASGWQGGVTYVNSASGIATNPGNWANQDDDWLPGSLNVFGIHVNSGGGAWTGSAPWFTMAIEFPGIDPTFVTECCEKIEPFLARLEQRLQSLTELVTLIQRQHVPFAYVPGLEYAGLTGNGEVTFSDPIMRAKVELTTLPGHYGMAEGHPDAIFDVGYVALGTADGFEAARAIAHTPMLLQVAGDVTKIGYSLNVGVVAKITTYSREP